LPSYKFIVEVMRIDNMSRYATDPITADDIIKYLEENDASALKNFTFEFEVCKAIIDKGETDIKFGGLYFDPDLKHNRQFDIRLKVSLPQQNIYFHLAIECKNLTTNNPLIVTTSPRMGKESFLQFWKFFQCSRDETVNGILQKSYLIGNDIFVMQEKCSDFYPIGKSVGRMCVQLGRHIDKQIGFIESDSECYDKWTQAFSSLAGMMEKACKWFLEQEENKGYVYGTHIFLPILIVPDGTLWCINYSQPDSHTTPCQENHISLFADRNYFVKGPRGGVRPYTASHLEIMTLSGLRAYLTRINSPSEPLISDSSNHELVWPQ